MYGLCPALHHCVHSCCHCRCLYTSTAGHLAADWGWLRAAHCHSHCVQGLNFMKWLQAAHKYLLDKKLRRPPPASHGAVLAAHSAV